jgi:hypothetical protein
MNSKHANQTSLFNWNSMWEKVKLFKMFMYPEKRKRYVDLKSCILCNIVSFSKNSSSVVTVKISNYKRRDHLTFASVSVNPSMTSNRPEFHCEKLLLFIIIPIILYYVVTFAFQRILEVLKPKLCWVTVPERWKINLANQCDVKQNMNMRARFVIFSRFLVFFFDLIQLFLENFIFLVVNESCPLAILSSSDRLYWKQI